MNKSKKKKYLSLALILCISVGFAAVTTRLSIFGGAHVVGPKLKVRFENVNQLKSSGNDTPVISKDGTKVTYSANFEKTGTYSFTVDVKNVGAFDAIITNFNNGVYNSAGEEVELPDAIEYSITYADGTEIENNHLLEIGYSETLLVKVIYREALEEDLDVTFELSMEYIVDDGSGIEPRSVVCRRAKTLHTEICNNNEADTCIGANYQIGDTVTYGNQDPTIGTLTTGDAFTCDVNGDEIFDEETERFYYVSKYYNTSTKSFDSSYATLIYYTDIDSSYYSEDESNNAEGPVVAASKLPSVDDWKAVSLYNSVRTILNSDGGNKTGAGTLSTFDYGDRAARLITTKELETACGFTVGKKTVGELDSCEFLMENSAYTDPDSSTYYWTETPLASNTRVYGVRVFTRYLNNVQTTLNAGVRPVIEVPITEIKY